jgi:hypothetical protein
LAIQDYGARFRVDGQHRAAADVRHEHLEQPLHAGVELERRRKLPTCERDQIGAALRRLGGRPRSLGARDFRRAPLSAIEIHEHPHLATQDRGHDGRQDVVDGAELIAALRLHLVGIRRDEDDRRMRRPAVLADQLGRLDSIDVRHVDVEHDHGELALEQLAQRFGARVHEHEVFVEILEHLAEREALIGQVVDHENVDFLFHRQR